MEIRVGPFTYRVRLVHGVIEHEGEACHGLCDHLRQEILISDEPPESQRLRVFFHEMMHAWWYHFAVDPSDEEAVVDLVGVAMTDFLIEALRLWRQAQFVPCGVEIAALVPVLTLRDSEQAGALPAHRIEYERHCARGVAGLSRFVAGP